MLAVKFYMGTMSLCAYQRVLKGMITWNLLLIEFLQNTNAYSESSDLSPSTIFIPPLDCRTLESLASKTNTVHPWLSEPLWSGGCLNKWTPLPNWNYPKCKYQQHHYTLYVLLHFTVALALAWILLVRRKQVTYRWLKYKSHYKIHVATNIMKIHGKLQAFVNLDNWGSDNRGHTIMQKKGLQAVSFKLWTASC